VCEALWSAATSRSTPKIVANGIPYIHSHTAIDDYDGGQKGEEIMKKLFHSVLLLALLWVSADANGIQDQDTDFIKKFIAKQAAREAGEEYEDARKVVTGDLNRDGTSDLAVLYTIEGQNGSNNHVQYLAVFTRLNGKLVALTHTSVGGKSHRGVELKTISKGAILLNTLNYAPQDASCCPSKKGTTRYVLIKGKLRER
jgi:hypothetical protein